AVDDVFESDVRGDLERAPPHDAAQAPRYAKRRREQHGAGIGAPPQDRLTALVPGKDTAAIRRQQSLGTQVAAGGEETVRLFQRFGRRWKEVRVRPGRKPTNGGHRAPTLRGDTARGPLNSLCKHLLASLHESRTAGPHAESADPAAGATTRSPSA